MPLEGLRKEVKIKFPTASYGGYNMNQQYVKYYSIKITTICSQISEIKLPNYRKSDQKLCNQGVKIIMFASSKFGETIN